MNIQNESGDRIEAHKRSPQTCIYCDDTSLTKEHVVPDGIGGRLWAYILCSKHNGLVNAADQRLNEMLAPYVTMLQVARQRGGVGAEFTATDDAGRPVIIVGEGFAKQKALDVKSRDIDGKITHAVGDLDKLDRLPKAALSPAGSNHVMAMITVPEVNVEIGSDDSLVGAILKMALHFYAAFVDDVPRAEGLSLLPYILDGKAAAGTYVRTPLLSDSIFPDSWPPRHEITCYPYGESSLVTVLLFGAYAYTCLFPFRTPGETGIRYRQVLSENFPQFYDDVPVPVDLDWNDGPGLYDHDVYFGPIERRLRRIHEHGAEQAVRARCRRAVEWADAMSSNYGDSWERYRAALQLECFSAEDVEIMVAIGRRLQREKKPVWEVPVRIGVESQV